MPSFNIHVLKLLPIRALRDVSVHCRKRPSSLRLSMMRIPIVRMAYENMEESCVFFGHKGSHTGGVLGCGMLLSIQYLRNAVRGIQKITWR